MVNLAKKLALATGIVAAVALTAVPQQPANALGTGAAVGLGLGAFALGSAVGAGASPYYNPYYAPPAYYYPPAPYYPAARSCWSPYYRTYVAC